MLGDRAGDMIPSHLIGNLNPEPAGDFRWVQPGKAAWDWWSGPVAGMKPDMDSYRRFIDFAAASGLRYYLIESARPFCRLAAPCLAAMGRCSWPPPSPRARPVL
jgi:hypothetical protein